MRALCGAIITAGALLGLGLTALAFGSRYSYLALNLDTEGNAQPLHLSDMDKPMVFILVLLTAMAIIGLGITFVGLAYHHHRRYHEMLHHRAKAAGGERIGV